MFRTVGDEGVSALFRYQPFNSDRLLQVLRDGKLYLSCPRDFNDPWDCKPWFNTELLTDPQYLASAVEWYVGVTFAHAPTVPADEVFRRADYFRRNPHVVAEKIKEVSRGIGGTIDRRYRVCCFSDSPTVPLMWAHYADRHRGLCLEFSTQNTVFSAALKVEYHPTYPPFDLTASDTDSALLPLLAKSNDWSYEHEYRLIAQERAVAVGGPTLLTDSGFLALPDGCLMSVIVGCMADHRVIQEVKQLIRTTAPRVALKIATRLPDRYELAVTTAP